MNRQTFKIRSILVFVLIAGLFTGLYCRVFHLYRHHMILFYSPDRMEAYIDGECLNMAHPLQVTKPDINVYFEQVLQRPHKTLFLQYFENMFIRETLNYSIKWKFNPDDIPPWTQKTSWGQILLEKFHISQKGSFSRFHPLYLKHQRYDLDEFVFETDVVMPISMRIHLVDEKDRNRNIFGADFYSGSYYFALNDKWEWTQKYFINDSMHRNLKTAFSFKVLSSISASFLFIAFAGMFFGLFQFCSRMFPLRNKVSALQEKIVHVYKKSIPKSEWLRRFPWEAIGITILAFLGAWLVGSHLFNHIPHVNDEGIYLFQAKVFASGNWYIEPPEPRECFQHLGIWQADRMFSYYTYGHSLILALGFLLGCHKIVPALLAAITVLFTILTGIRIYKSRWTAALSGLLLISSPLFIILAASYMSHVSSMAANMMFLYFLIRTRETESKWWAIATGLALGSGFVIRPVTIILFAFFPLIYYFLRKLTKRRLVLIFLIIVFAALVSSTAYIHAYKTTGNWELIQRQVETRFESGNDQATFWKYMHQNGTWFLKRSFGWIPYFSLMFTALPFILFSRNKWDWIFISGFIVNAYIYSSLAHFGWTHEPRYWSEFMPLIALLSARGIQHLGNILNSILHTKIAKPFTGTIGVLIILILFSVSLDEYWPYEIESYSNYCSILDETYNKVLETEESGSIILFKGHPDYIYIPHFYRNEIPGFEGSIIYAMDRNDSATAKLLGMYPERSVFVVEDREPVRRIR
ncbi:glycosyltransferase family 39 protein [bacterium]|nr:glycosyltransferase family 39 protein [bacterium]